MHWAHCRAWRGPPAVAQCVNGLPHINTHGSRAYYQSRCHSGDDVGRSGHGVDAEKEVGRSGPGVDDEEDDYIMADPTGSRTGAPTWSACPSARLGPPAPSDRSPPKTFPRRQSVDAPCAPGGRAGTYPPTTVSPPSPYPFQAEATPVQESELHWAAAPPALPATPRGPAACAPDPPAPAGSQAPRDIARAAGRTDPREHAGYTAPADGLAPHGAPPTPACRHRITGSRPAGAAGPPGDR